jgi:hypothetical protein
MVEPQGAGSCNPCHTKDGYYDAPGRIMLP